MARRSSPTCKRRCRGRPAGSARTARVTCQVGKLSTIQVQVITRRWLFLLLRLIFICSAPSGCICTVRIGEFREIPADHGLAEALLEHLFLARDLVAPSGLEIFAAQTPAHADRLV